MPNPITPTSATASRLSAALAITPRRSRQPVPAPRLRDGASTRNGSASPAVTFTPMPTASAPAPARIRGWVPVASASALASASSSSVSLCAPPTASASSTGFSPTNAVAQRAESPDRSQVRAISATAARLAATDSALNAHSPPASPSGAVA
jgi:hypothetical protein